MTDSRQCVNCGTILPPDAPTGVCPKCLLRAGLEDLDSNTPHEATLIESGEPGGGDVVGSEASATEPESSNGFDVGTKVRYFGDYELLEEIARGGMGIVYKARQVRLNRVVALKMILSGQLASELEIQRFHAEAEAAAQLDHPGIVPIFEVGEHEGHHFYSMALVDGESLAKRIAQSPLPPREAVEIVRKAALAVHYAHEKGVVHRDIKPANILIEKNDQPRVADFGLAKQLSSEDSLTATGQVLGTPSFMAPEQASGRTGKIGPATDIYSLGAVLYATLTGRPPFQAGNVLDTLKLVTESEPVSPRQLNGLLTVDLETICLKCLRKDPARRYATAQELADDLQRFLEGKPIHARPVSSLESTWRWCRRNPVVSILSILTVLLLVTGAGTATYLAYLANLQSHFTRSELYRNQIMLAEREIESGKSYPAQQILAECPKQFRGWEWDYILRLSLISPSQTLQYESKPIVGVDFSKRGNRLVSITQDGKINVRGGNTLQLLHECELSGEDIQHFHLSPDGTRAFVGTASHKMDVNVDDGAVLWEDDSNPLYILNDDGKVAIALRFSDNQVRIEAMVAGTDEVIWSTECDWEGWNGNRFVHAEFDQTGTRLRVICGRTAFLLNATSGEQLYAGPTADVSATNDSLRDGWYVVGAGGRWEQTIFHKSVGMFNTRVLVANLEQPERNIELPMAPAHVLHPQLSADGSMLAYAVSAFDAMEIVAPELLESSAILKEFQETQLAKNVMGGGASTYLVYVYETRTGSLRQVMRGFSGSQLNGLAFDSTGTRLCAWGGGKPWHWENSDEPSEAEIRVWNIWRSRTATVLQGHQAEIRRVAVTSDNKKILSSSQDGTVLVWDADSGQLLRIFDAHQRDAGGERQLTPGELDGHRATHVTVSNQEKIAVSIGGNSIRIWNHETGEILHTLPFPDWSCSGLALSNDGKLFAFRSGGNVYLYQTGSATQVATWEGAYAQQLAFDPAGQRLAVAFQHDIMGELRVYDTTTHKLILQRDIRPENFSLLTSGWGLVSVAFTPDGERIIAGGNVGAAVVFDAQTGAPLMELAGHTATIMSVAVSPDGTRFATGSYDNTVRLWDAQSGQLVHTFRDHTKPILHVDFSPDGKSLVSGGQDGIVRIWKSGL
ncbi:MAG: protein kinase [Planctomycetaceae bacterium]